MGKKRKGLKLWTPFRSLRLAGKVFKVCGCEVGVTTPAAAPSNTRARQTNNPPPANMGASLPDIATHRDASNTLLISPTLSSLTILVLLLSNQCRYSMLPALGWLRFRIPASL